MTHDLTDRGMAVDDAMVERFRAALPFYVRRPKREDVRVALEAALSKPLEKDTA